MFKYIDITFDYKELQSIKECLEKQISELEKQTKQNKTMKQSMNINMY